MVRLERHFDYDVGRQRTTTDGINMCWPMRSLTYHMNIHNSSTLIDSQWLRSAQRGDFVYVPAKHKTWVRAVSELLRRKHGTLPLHLRSPFTNHQPRSVPDWTQIPPVQVRLLYLRELLRIIDLLTYSLIYLILDRLYRLRGWFLVMDVRSSKVSESGKFYINVRQRHIRTRDTLRIFTSTQTVTLKLTLTLTLTLTDTGGAVLTLMLGYRRRNYKLKRKKTALLKPKNTKLR